MIDWGTIVEGARFRADMQATDRVLEGEWIQLAVEAVEACWNEATLARPDFQFSSYDFSLVSGGSASVAVPPDFHSLIDVVFGPDTTQEYSLGPFAWQNRRSPGGWWPPFMTSGVGPGATRATLKGSLVYIEPSLRAAGNYRLWYCPRAHVPKWIVRLATTTVLPACTAAGAGIGKTLTGNAVGVLAIDGRDVVLGDLVLIKNQAATADNGVYMMTVEGTPAVAFVLTRAVSFDATTEVAMGDIVGVGQTDPLETPGLLNEGKFFTVATFTAIEAAVTFADGAVLDPILDQFVELVKIKTAIPAMQRDGGVATTAVGDFIQRETKLIGAMKEYFAIVRSVTANKLIDTDSMGNRGWNGWSGGWG
jgi:hypothetical protein